MWKVYLTHNSTAQKPLWAYLISCHAHKSLFLGGRGEKSVPTYVVGISVYCLNVVHCADNSIYKLGKLMHQSKNWQTGTFQEVIFIKL